MRSIYLAAAGVILGLGTATFPVLADADLLDTVVGAGVGGLIGNQFGHGSGKLATTGAGVLVGGLVGHTLGQATDNDNTRQGYYSSYGYDGYYPATVYYQQAYTPTYVAPPPAQIVYVNPPPGYVENSSEETSQYCREYTQEIHSGDNVQESYGTACLQPDGSWQIMP